MEKNTQNNDLTMKTNEEKAKAYDEALERARKAYNAIPPESRGARKIIEDAFPELRESEDERIRKILIDMVKRETGFTGFPSQGQVLAWLEKQKECHSDDVLNRTYQNGFEDGFKAGKEVERRNSSDNDFIKPRMQEPWNNEKQKEQKPEKVLYIPKFRTGDLVRSSKNPRLTYKIFSVGSMNELGNSEYEVEIFTDGKPDEPRNLKHIEIEKMDSWGELVKQKPAEWSEDFDKEVENIHKRYPEVSFAKLTRIAYHFSKWANKRKDIEWGEEDEKIRKLLIWQVHRNIEDDTNDLAQSVYDGIKGHDPDLEESIEDGKKCLAWLKSLRPSWKPSEEQMKALQCSIAFMEIRKSSDYDIPPLKSLYEQLKKLLP